MLIYHFPRRWVQPTAFFRPDSGLQGLRQVLVRVTQGQPCQLGTYRGFYNDLLVITVVIVRSDLTVTW